MISTAHRVKLSLFGPNWFWLFKTVRFVILIVFFIYPLLRHRFILFWMNFCAINNMYMYFWKWHTRLFHNKGEETTFYIDAYMYIALKSLVQMKLFIIQVYSRNFTQSVMLKKLSTHAKYYIEKLFNNFFLTFFNYPLTLPFHAIKKICI